VPASERLGDGLQLMGRCQQLIGEGTGEIHVAG
jgi:hypothetical protein